MILGQLYATLITHLFSFSFGGVGDDMRYFDFNIFSLQQDKGSNLLLSTSHLACVMQMLLK